MKKDIESRSDIELLVNNFYGTALNDPLIGHFFTKVRKLDMTTHAPKICDFWEGILFGAMKFKGNPMLSHIAINSDEPLLQEHFDRWFKLWEENANTLFNGPKATEAIDRAKNIAMIMSLKIQDVNK